MIITSRVSPTLSHSLISCRGVFFRQMPSRADKLPLDDPAMAEALLKCFSAFSRSKKLKDSDTEKPVTDLFMAKAGVNAIRVISVMAKLKELEDMKFSEI